MIAKATKADTVTVVKNSIIRLLLLGLLTNSLHALELKIEDGLKLPSGLQEKVTATALAHHPGKPESIEFYRVADRSDLCFGLVKFERETTGTQAVNFYYHATIRLEDGSIRKEDTFTNVFSIFPLKKATLILRLDDKTPYDLVLKLLQALDRGSILVKNGSTSTREGDRLFVHESLVKAKIPDSAELKNVMTVDYNPDTANFRLITNSGKGWGKVFNFTQEQGHFRCTSTADAWF